MTQQVDLSVRGPLNDFSGTVALGGQSQLVLASGQSANLNYLFIQNPSGQNESLFVNFGADASAIDNKSVELLPGQDITMKTPGFITNQQINVTAATNGHPFVCKAA